MKLSRQKSSEYGKRTDRFLLKTSKDQDKILFSWASWTRRAFNYIVVAEYAKVKEQINQFEINRKWIYNDKLFKEMEFELKSRHVEGLAAKIAATVKAPKATSSFIVSRNMVGKIVKTEGGYLFHVSHPFEKGMLDIGINPKDRRGHLEAHRLDPYLNIDFPFEIHRNKKRHHWILHCTRDYEVGPAIPTSRIMGIDVGVRNLVYAVVREESKCVWSHRWPKHYLDKMGRWKRDYEQHQIATQLVEKARELNARIRLEDLDVKNMLENKGKENEFDIRTHRSLSNVGMRKMQDLIEAHARSPKYIEKRLQPQVEVEYVDARYSTRTCPKCMFIEGSEKDLVSDHEELDQSNNVSDIIFNCKKCKHSYNYDFMAAWNLGKTAQNHVLATPSTL